MKNRKLLYGLIILAVAAVSLFLWNNYQTAFVSSSRLPIDSPPPEVTFNNKVYVPAKCLMPALTPVKKIGITTEGFEVFNVIISPSKDPNILLKSSSGRYQCYGPKPNLEQKEVPYVHDPDLPLHIALNIDRAPRVGETATITWRVSSDWDAPKIESHLELPDGIKQVGGTTNWQGGLPAGGWQELSATIKVVKQGVYEIRGLVRGGELSLLYLTVTATGSKIGLVPLSGDPRRVQVEQPEGGESLLEEQPEVKPEGEIVAPEPPALDPTKVSE